MASLLQSTISLSHHYSTPYLPLTPTPKCVGGSSFPRIRCSEPLFGSAVLSNGKSFTAKREFVCHSGRDEVSTIYPSETEQSKADAIASFKFKLLVCVEFLIFYFIFS